MKVEKYWNKVRNAETWTCVEKFKAARWSRAIRMNPGIMLVSFYFTYNNSTCRVFDRPGAKTRAMETLANQSTVCVSYLFISSASDSLALGFAFVYISCWSLRMRPVLPDSSSRSLFTGNSCSGIQNNWLLLILRQNHCFVTLGYYFLIKILQLTTSPCSALQSQERSA